MQGLRQLIDAGREKQIQALRERGIQSGSAIRGLCYVELTHRDRRTGCVWPGDARGIVAQRRNEDVVVPRCINVEIGLLAGYGCRGEHSVLVGDRESLGRCAFDPGEDHVPDATAPSAQAAITGVPLLLRAGSHLTVYLAVGDEAAAGKTSPISLVGRTHREIAANMQTPHRRRLRYRPAIRAARGRNGHVFYRAPEILRRIRRVT